MPKLEELLKPAENWMPEEQDIVNTMAAVSEITGKPSNRNGVIKHLRYEKKKELAKQYLGLTSGEANSYMDAVRCCHDNGGQGSPEDIAAAIDELLNVFSVENDEVENQFAETRTDLASLKTKLLAFGQN